jgi:hypothetical protein
VLQEDEADASELYFGSMDTAGEGSNSPEAVAWWQKSSAICQQLTPLQRSQVGVTAGCCASLLVLMLLRLFMFWMLNLQVANHMHGPAHSEPDVVWIACMYACRLSRLALLG